jgi:hypothetical protein
MCTYSQFPTIRSHHEDYSILHHPHLITAFDAVAVADAIEETNKWEILLEIFSSFDLEIFISE